MKDDRDSLAAEYKKKRMQHAFQKQKIQAHRDAVSQQNRIRRDAVKSEHKPQYLEQEMQSIGAQSDLKKQLGMKVQSDVNGLSQNSFNLQSRSAPRVNSAVFNIAERTNAAGYLRKKLLFKQKNVERLQGIIQRKNIPLQDKNDLSLNADALRQKKKFQRNKTVQKLQIRKKDEQNFQKKNDSKISQKSLGNVYKEESNSHQTPVINQNMLDMKTKLHIKSETEQTEKIRRAFVQDASARTAKSEPQLEQAKNGRKIQISEKSIPGQKISGKQTAGSGEKKSGTEFGLSELKAGKAEAFEDRKQRAKKKYQRSYAAKILGRQNQMKQDGSQYQQAELHVMQDIVIKHVKRTAALVSGGVFIILVLLAVFLFFTFGMLIIAVTNTGTIAGTPQSYFENVFVNETNLLQQETYIDTVLQEKYNNFADDITDFISEDPNNSVVYASGISIYSKNSVLAVYFSKLCTSSYYEDSYDTHNDVSKKYPQYLLVDTNKEKELLTEVFEQMNYTVIETVQIQVPPAEEGEEPQTVDAKQMTVFQLSIAEWKALHPSYLSSEGENLLDVLKQYENTYSQGAGTGSYVALDSITIPEGANRNLIYMAGFLEAEAGNQTNNDREGQRAVAYVILNRAGGNINNVIPVLLAPYQFSCYVPNHTVEAKIQRYASMTEEQRNADPIYNICVQASQGSCDNPIGSWKYFCNPSGSTGGAAAQWARIKAKNTEDQYKQIQDHVFCQNCW